MRRRNKLPLTTSKRPRRGKLQLVTDMVDDNKPSYIQKVPTEILGHIFQHYVDQNQSAWGLTLVSELWKGVALSHPRLWACIFATSFRIESGEEKWTVRGISEVMSSLGSFQVCRNSNGILAAISRSGNVPLTVRCNGSTLHRGVWGLMQPLFEPEISSRIEWLEALFARDPGSVMNLGHLFTTAQFTTLRSLRLPSGGDHKWKSSLLSRIKETAMVLDEACVEVKWLAPLVDGSFWGRLRVLEDSSISDQSLTLNNIIPQCARLTSLVTHWRRILVQRDALINIKSLDIKCDPTRLSHLDLSNLKDLSLRSSSLYHSAVSHTTLPKLTRLVLKSEKIDWLGDLDMPRLEELSICTDNDLLEMHGYYPSPPLTPSSLYVSTYFPRVFFPSVLSLTWNPAARMITL